VTTRRAALAAGLALAASRGAAAATGSYPERPVRLLVGYAPGGLTDTTARLVAEGIGRPLGQPVVVENRPGANSQLAAGLVAASPPDGHTLLMVIGAHAANATLYAGRTPYDPVNGFAPVSHVVSTPLVMAAGPGVRANTLAELLAEARARPGAIDFGSSGVGSAAHLTTADLMLRTGVRMNHVPYRGTQPALQDLLAGRIGAMIDTHSAFAPHFAAGTLKRIAVASAARPRFDPELPTFAEGGVPDFVASAWCLLLAPAGTPPAVLNRVSGAVSALLAEPAMRARLDGLGYEPVGSDPTAAAAFLRAEIERWGAVIRAANVQVE